MEKSAINTPVLFVIFNRPNTTAQVFREIANAKPPKLFIAADGPRSDRPDEAEQCAKARAITDQVDWNCEVNTLFRENNLGCRQAVSSAIDWFFEHVEEGVILEDDCLPHPTFFNFCAALLQYYRHDNRIMHIAGANFLGERLNYPYSYYFSHYPSIWGWATWRRAWAYYDADMSILKECGYSILDLLYSDPVERQERAILLSKVQSGEIDTWDYQWDFACRIQNGLSVIPSVNMISNIGYGQGATRTKAVDSRMNLPTFPLENISHPSYVVRNWYADNLRYQLHFCPRTAHNMTTCERVKRSLARFWNLR